MYRIIIKLTGIGMVAGSCVMAGFLSAKKLRLHMEELYRVQRIVQRVQSEIRYHNQEMYAILKNIGQEEVAPYNQWLTSIAEKIKTREGPQFQTIWTTTIDEVLHTPSCHLRREDLIKLEQLGVAFGQVDVKLQNGIIEQYLEELGQETMKEKEVMAGQIKLRCTLGITAGTFLMVLLI